MTITTTTTDNPCTGCSTRAGSCEVQRWLSGRLCCPDCSDCSHPSADQEARP